MFKYLLKNLFLLILMFIGFVFFGTIFTMFVNYAITHLWVIVLTSVFVIGLLFYFAMYQCE